MKRVFTNCVPACHLFQASCRPCRVSPFVLLTLLTASPRRRVRDVNRLAEFDVQYGNATHRRGPFVSLVAVDGSFLTVSQTPGEVYDVTEHFKPHPQSRFVIGECRQWTAVM